jgi:hypothetical protein
VDLSDNVVANNFILVDGIELASFEAWLAEEGLNDDDGELGTFSGTLSWAIYADSVEPPNRPGSLLDSGTAVELVAVDSGRQSFWNTDVVRVRARLGHSVALAAGTWWLALHEGLWGSDSDSSSVLWVTGLGGPESYLYWDDDEASPGTWPFNFGLGPSSAFAITEELIFASGFEAGVTCAWTNGFEVDCL